MAESKNPDTEKLLHQMKEWLNSQPYLPKDLDDRLLVRFLHSCYYDLEKAKSAVELFCTIRGSSFDLMSNRDPLSPQMQKILKIVNQTHYPLSGNRILWIWQLNDPGLDNYDYLSDAKLFFLSMDAWFLTEDMLEEEDIAILDVKDISLKFLTKFNMSIAKRLSKYQEEAIPIRLKQIHVVNAPSVIDKLFALMKPLLKQDFTNMIHFYPPKSDKLLQYFSKEELPEDFGGTQPKMAELNKKVLEKILGNRELLMNENLWRAVDTKKSKNKKESAPEVNSFRSLAID